jgi:NADPH:quinone reductase-like Zn-dependent oxidoreductase
VKLKRLVRWTALAVCLAATLALAVAYWRSDNDCAARLATTPRQPMQAYVYCDYGPPDVLRLAALEKPVPAAGEVLVRVRAAAVNPLDWHYVRGTPYVMRFGTGLRKPAVIRLGVDFAGTVEAIGPGVTRFAPGDDVLGGRTGAFAEYVVMREDRPLVRKPTGVSFEQAAAVPIAAVTALQGLRDKGRIARGQKVLINGASGGVGTYAVQIARHFGADVTGVCSTRNVDLVRSLGAAHVIDYTRTDFTMGTARYDIVLDNVGNQPIGAVRRTLTEGGRYVLVGGGGPDDHRWLGPLGRVVGLYVRAPFVSQQLGMFIAELNVRDLDLLARLLQDGTIKSVIDRRYRWPAVPDAIRYVEQGRARGKVIVTFEDVTP